MKSIIGTWALVRASATTTDGRPSRTPYGGHGMGRVMFNADGRMIAVLCDGRRDMPDGEAREYNSYCGNYTFDGKRLVTRVDACSNPANMGSDQVRDVSFEGDLMVLRPPLRSRMPGTPVVQSVLWWERQADV